MSFNVNGIQFENFLDFGEEEKVNKLKVFYLLNFLSKFIFEIAYLRPNDHPEDHVNRPSDSLSHKIMSRNIR